MFYQISYLIVKSFDEVLGIKYVTLVLLMWKCESVLVEKLSFQYTGVDFLF